MNYPDTIDSFLCDAEMSLIEGFAVEYMEISHPDIINIVEVHMSSRPIVPLRLRPKSRTVARYLIAQYWREHFDGDALRFSDAILLVDGTRLRGDRARRYERMVASQFIEGVAQDACREPTA